MSWGVCRLNPMIYARCKPVRIRIIAPMVRKGGLQDGLGRRVRGVYSGVSVVKVLQDVHVGR